MALIILAALAAAALVMMGWNQWTTTEMVNTQTKANETMAREWREATLTLVLGYRDSQPSSEASSTESPENETPPSDVNNLDDMPEHIREHYLREQEEDEMMANLSSTRSFPLQPTSS